MFQMTTAKGLWGRIDAPYDYSGYTVGTYTYVYAQSVLIVVGRLQYLIQQSKDCRRDVWLHLTITVGTHTYVGICTISTDCSGVRHLAQQS